MEKTTARLFKDGQGQAVRIPRGMEFKNVDEVEIRGEVDAIVLRPGFGPNRNRKSWLTFAEDVAAAGGADDDFMRERRQFNIFGRVNFDKDK